MKKLVFFIFLVFSFLAFWPAFFLKGRALAVGSFAVKGKAASSLTPNFLNFSDYNANVRLNVAAGDYYVFSGYAFSEDFGWVAFGATDNPAGPVKVNIATGEVSGKAKVLNTTGYFDFDGYESNVVVDLESGKMSGYVFSEDGGWFNFG